MNSILQEDKLKLFIPKIVLRHLWPEESFDQFLTRTTEVWYEQWGRHPERQPMKILNFSAHLWIQHEPVLWALLFPKIGKQHVDGGQYLKRPHAKKNFMKFARTNGYSFEFLFAKPRRPKVTENRDLSKVLYPFNINHRRACWHQKP